MNNICVFCGSSSGNDPIFAESSQALGRELVKHKLGLVYGGEWQVGAVRSCGEESQVGLWV
jgi:predicted Rossmann-fold nucleotide-binding protein